MPVCSAKEIPAHRHGHKWLLTGTSEDGYHGGSTTTGLVEQYGSDSIKEEDKNWSTTTLAHMGRQVWESWSLNPEETSFLETLAKLFLTTRVPYR